MERISKNMFILIIIFSIVALAIIFHFQTNSFFMMSAIFFIILLECYTFYRIKKFFIVNYRLSWMLFLFNIISSIFWVFLVLKGHPSALIGVYSLSLLVVSTIDNND